MFTTDDRITEVMYLAIADREHRVECLLTLFIPQIRQLCITARRTLYCRQTILLLARNRAESSDVVHDGLSE